MIGEILFENIKVSTLSIDYLCAMLACLVHEDKANATPPEDPKLNELYIQVQEVAKKIAATSIASRLDLDPKAYVSKFDPSVSSVCIIQLDQSPSVSANECYVEMDEERLLWRYSQRYGSLRRVGC